MDVMGRIERALYAAVSRADVEGCPPRLAAAMRHAVLPRGARIRPRLCLAVAAACGEDDPAVTDAAAAAIELLHCASLVHDDLPCFDDADTRRGRPTVHRAFGEPLAVLAGDALIVLAFQTLAHGAALTPKRLAPLMLTIAGSVGVPFGIVAGQAWECEDTVDLAQYQREKTEAFQVADDILDATAHPDAVGKPVGKDIALDRPSAVRELGLDGAIMRLETLAAAAVDAVPACPGAVALRSHILTETMRLLPKELVRHAA